MERGRKKKKKKEGKGQPIKADWGGRDTPAKRNEAENSNKAVYWFRPRGERVKQ